MFSDFTIFTQTQKNKSIVNLYQKEWLGCFSEDIKMWPFHNVLNQYTSDWLLFDIYANSMALNTNVKSDILSTLQQSKYQRMKLLFKIAALGLQGLSDN